MFILVRFPPSNTHFYQSEFDNLEKEKAQLKALCDQLKSELLAAQNESKELSERLFKQTNEDSLQKVELAKLHSLIKDLRREVDDSQDKLIQSEQSKIELVSSRNDDIKKLDQEIESLYAKNKALRETTMHQQVYSIKHSL